MAGEIKNRLSQLLTNLKIKLKLSLETTTKELCVAIFIIQLAWTRLFYRTGDLVTESLYFNPWQGQYLFIAGQGDKMSINSL